MLAMFHVGFISSEGLTVHEQCLWCESGNQASGLGTAKAPQLVTNWGTTASISAFLLIAIF